MAAWDLKHLRLTGEPHADDLTQKGSPRALLTLGLTAPLAGLGAGVVGAFFRLTLEEAARLRGTLLHEMNAWSVGGLALVMVLAAAAAAIAAWLVRRVPSAAGSRIPRVMAVLDDEAPPAPARVIPAKFVAGTLAIGAGLALGREGPSVQMGASIAYQTGRLLRRSWTDCRVLLAAGAGAGFATAFNAPIAGAKMTADVTMLLPVIVACAVAMLTPTLFGDRAILESLKARFLGGKPNLAPEED